MSTSAKIATAAPYRPVEKPRKSRRLWFAFLLLVLALLSLTEPRVYRFVVRQLITLEAWRNGADVTIRRIDGSIFEPLVLIDSNWSYRSRNGAATRLQIARAETKTRWKHLFTNGSMRWLQQLRVEGVTGKIALPRQAVPTEDPLEFLRGRWLPVPARIEASNVDLMIESDGDYVWIERSQFVASELEPGILRAGRVTIKQPWLNRTFRDVRGTTALRDSELVIANLVLEPGIEVRNFAAELRDLAEGRLNLAVTVGTFGGEIKAQAQVWPDAEHLTFDASGNFTQIAVAKLSAFLGLSDAAGGTIRSGTFRFRGAPRQLDKATTSVWLDAANFQWESRQWDTLALGATLRERRLVVSKLDLRQGQNTLDLSGEMALPMPGVKWWQSEFTANIAAKIENLTELSALMLPEFKFVAGKAHIDGSVRGRNQQFTGQLIVSGSGLKWRNAPIENLHAAVKLNGNECQVSNIELFNAGDYVRGRGAVSILGPVQYWGYLRASVDDLATYAAILQKPIVPEPLAGGAVIEWWGDGSAKGHTGKFLGKLNKLRTLGALASQLHPINAELAGGYAPGSLQFSKFTLADDDSSFTANVDVASKAVRLQGIRLMHGQHLGLEGDALLPLDLWQAWPNTSLATLLNNETVSKVSLQAYNFDLHRASQLLSWKFPIAGTVTGSLTLDGPVGALTAGGRLALEAGRIPLGWSGDILDHARAAATFRGAEIALDSATARHRFGDLQLSGTIGLQNVRDPRLKLRVRSDKVTLPLFEGVTIGARDEAITAAAGLVTVGRFGAARDNVLASAALDLEIDGPLSAATVRGKASLTGLDTGIAPDVAAFWNDPAQLTLPPPFQLTAAPTSSWRLDVACRADGAPLANNPGVLSADLQLTGILGQPLLDGTARFSGAQAAAGRRVLTASDASLIFHPDRPSNPTLDARFTGAIFGEPFTALVAGPLSHPVRWFVAQPPLTDTLIWESLARPVDETPKGPPRVSLRESSPFTTGVNEFTWAEIESPPSAETTAVSVDTEAPTENFQ